MSRSSNRLRSLASFPNPVNEVTARVVATGVVLLGATALLLGLRWLTVVLAIGFALRVLAGPRFSPLAILAVRVIVPRLPWEPKLVPGPPKRFAQAIGLACSATSALLLLVFGLHTAGWIVLAVLVVAASLEAFAGICLGCAAFALLMRAGVIPATVCERCDDIWGGSRQAAPTPPAP